MPRPVQRGRSIFESLPPVVDEKTGEENSCTQTGCGCLILFFLGYSLLYAFGWAGPSLEDRKNQEAAIEKQIQVQRETERQDQLHKEKERQLAGQQRLERQRAEGIAAQQKQQQAETDRRQKIDFLSKKAIELKNELSSATPYNELILSYRYDGTFLNYTVENTWFFLPKQIRLQHAQRLGAKWSLMHPVNDRDSARIKILDVNGNKVGGHGLLGIYVDE